MSSFYTRTGDGGTTGLLGKGRVLKSDLCIETIGSIDEASAALGMARSISNSPDADMVIQVQRDLYGIMGEAAATPENRQRFRVVGAEQVTWLEAQIERISGMVEVPNQFITPGDCPAGAAFDMARTIVRRAERRLVELAARGDVENPDLQKYLNRLSSLCFVMELHEIKLAGGAKSTMMKANHT
jgi:cob(I)alamin adenosyltransferase